MLRGTGATASVIQAAGAPGAGVSARPNRLLEQVQRAGDVGVDEVPARVRADVGLVERRRVQDGVGVADGVAGDRAVRDRTDHVRVRRGLDVESGGLVARGGEHSHERLAEVARAAGDEDPHRVTVAAG